MRRTLVYQAWDSPNPPAWIARCMEHARDWAARRGYEYRRIGAKFFEVIPDWVGATSRADKLMLSDPCRLVFATRLLEEGYDRVIWVDADVLIFQPDRFDVDCSTTGYVVCSEVWLRRYEQVNGQPVMEPSYRKNGCVLGFDRANAFLPFYLDACWQILRHRTKLNSWAMGPGFLSGLFEQLPMAVKNDVGMCHPAILFSLLGRLRAGRATLEKYLAMLPETPLAANLGGSLAGRTYGRRHLSHDDMGVIVERLVAHREFLAAALPFQAGA